MGLRVALLISAALLALGCVKGSAVAQSRDGCGSCHTPHYVEAGACDDCHRGQPLAMRKELAHVRLLTGKAAEHSLANGRAVEEGRKLVEAAACRRCHTIEGRGNRLAANLDEAAWGREQKELMSSITAPAPDMPVFNFDPSQTEALIAYLLNGRRPTASEQAYRVQFVRGAVRVQSVFDEKCGGCHRLLTRLGPSGVGTRGPNLSGLFTDFYPPNAPASTGGLVPLWLIGSPTLALFGSEH